jgi:predicted alpha-1,2-mannosidase
MRILKTLVTGGFIFLAGFQTRAQAPVPASGTGDMGKSQDNLEYVDPTIGNVGALLQPTRPTVQLPHQMIRMYPTRKDYIDDQIADFPLIIVSHRLGQAFSIKPARSAPGVDGWTHLMADDQGSEVTRPWYYAGYLLDDEVSVEFTPGKKTGIFRFGFGGNRPRTLLLGVYNQGNSQWHFLSGDEVTGVEIYHGDIPVYMYGRFSTPGEHGVLRDGKPVAGLDSISGKTARAWIRFPQSSPDTIEFRYAISFISPEQARRNFREELDGRRFADLQAAGEADWAAVTGQIHVEGGTEAQKRSFYSALYRCNERMVDITEDNQYYSGFDGKVHTASGHPFYVDDWIWDTYLALHPLRTLLNPAQEKDMLNSYVTMYSQLGWMPTFPVLFGDHACMNGFHSSIMILDDYRKGIRADDPAKAYEGMRKNATQATLLPWRNGPATSLDQFFYTHGYFPALRVGETETVREVDTRERRQAVAVTLGASYDDWAVSQMARELGKDSDYRFFLRRSGNYKNLWNPQRRMFLPKDDKGNWILIDPKFDGGSGGRDYYDENNGWTYLWQVQEDIPGLVDLMGGKDAFEARLDELFREGLDRSKSDFWYKFPDATGLVGQYSMGNEPSFHIPYLYNFTNAPWKTQERVRLLLDLWFKDNVFGIPGDEDGGGMSAFVVFSSMGFYPVTPGRPVYAIGSPVFEKVTIDLPNGRHFTVIAHGSSKVNKYIQRASLNGVSLDTPWFTHDQLVNGGTLELEMGPRPNKEWGIKS